LANSETPDLSLTESYFYELPEELIAQNPVERRDGSRLLRLSGERVTHGVFSDLPRLLRPGDMLVMNDTRVFRARLAGRKLPGGASVEIFCLNPVGGDGFSWASLVRPGRKLPPGTKVELAPGLVATIGERLEGGARLTSLPEGIPPALLFERYGKIPLPPYIKNSSSPPERYQTVYGKPENDRSVAAPTAGLHFTPELLDRLSESGIEREFITLDVGVGTFRPVKARDIRDHKMHSERCAISAGAASRINAAKKEGRRIAAVGTTVVRTLESMTDESGTLSSGELDTGIFIAPGYNFKMVDAILTNFHLPCSTLLMLVCAFAGYETTMNAYAEAVRHGYRFFSFGDAMLVERGGIC
jgi:S-adenosylmethionine:tRNA ribosyltransferase-isomerase